MLVIDSTLSLFSFFWIPKVLSLLFYAAPGDSIRVEISAKNELDGVYLGLYEDRPFLSEVYTRRVVWNIFSDSIRLYSITVFQRGFWERNRVNIRVYRKYGDSAYKDFDIRVSFKVKRIPYEDTLWERVYDEYHKWRFIIPPLSNTFYGAMFNGDAVFDIKNNGGLILWIAFTEYDDSIRFIYGDMFLKDRIRRNEVCSYSAKSGNLSLYILKYDDYAKGEILPVYDIKNVSRGCFKVERLNKGKYGIVIENTSSSSVDITLRLITVYLRPKVIRKYKSVKVPVRVGH